MGDYPYPARGAALAKREELQAPEDASRVLRGGSFWSYPLNVCCAARYGYAARGFAKYVGFRIVLVAGLP
jgi:formylglycine-generating enzyme required for sulfatase activity